MTSPDPDFDLSPPLIPRETPGRALRMAVACHEVVLGGGYLRFERMGEVLRAWGHELVWLCQWEPPAPQFPTAMPRYDLARASAQAWDAVMVPGGGFSTDTLEWFEALQDRRFGLRVQHVLNERKRCERFEQVHAHFQPDVVVFNNVDWPVEMYGRLPARAHHVLVGGVDAVACRPRPYRTHPLHAGRWVIGGQSRKNPELLLAALRLLPESVCIRLFGPDHLDLATQHRDLVAAGRLELTGPLFGEAMARFYDGIDCVVMAETVAGWANFVAEAMASGVPVICTSHGTWSLARDGETALMMDAPTPEAIAAQVRRLMTEPALCARLATEARDTATQFTWEAYAGGMLDIVTRNGAALGALRADRRLADLEVRLQAKEADLTTVLASTSWQLTGPLRGLVRALRRP